MNSLFTQLFFQSPINQYKHNSFLSFHLNRSKQPKNINLIWTQHEHKNPVIRFSTYNNRYSLMSNGSVTTLIQTTGVNSFNNNKLEIKCKIHRLSQFQVRIWRNQSLKVLTNISIEVFSEDSHSPDLKTVQKVNPYCLCLFSFKNVKIYCILPRIRGRFYSKKLNKKRFQKRRSWDRSEIFT